jgi:DNA (cytosine-5)-methyltransferase 1
VTFGSLFAGIGGFDLGLERAGMTCKWQVEIDPYARRVLEKHWPDVRRHDDVRTFPPEGEWGVDLICGGFPCQDISFAGKGAGLAGERSGLWYEYARIVGDLRPRYIVVENVSALLVRGMDAVLGTLASLGYDAEWACIPAAAVGAPHIRDRVWILAYAAGERQPEGGRLRSLEPSERTGGRVAEMANAKGQRNSDREKRTGWIGSSFRGPVIQSDWWESEPDVGRVAHGVPARVDRLRGLGNAVVPQVVEWIGRRILESEGVAP